MKLLGVTGGIGMGKSTCARLLEQQGIPILDTDLLARQVVQPGEPALAEVRAAFGDGVFSPDGQLRRDTLAELVFADSSARARLEAILHPRIHALWRAQADAWRKEARPMAAVIIPLLFETGVQSDFDAVVCVACSPATQQRRLTERGWTAEQIRQRNAAQWSIQKKLGHSSFVIWTEGGLEVHDAQLCRILSRC